MKRSKIRFTEAFEVIVVLLVYLFFYIKPEADPIQQKIKSFERVEATLKTNDVIAQRCLGIACFLGEDIHEDFRKSRELLLNASRKNDPIAKYFLGILDLEGYGAYAANSTKGWTNIKAAAEKNFPLALLKLADYELDEIRDILNTNKNPGKELTLILQQKSNHIQTLLKRALAAKDTPSLLPFDSSDDLKNSFPETRLALINETDKLYEWIEIEMGIFYLKENNPIKNPTKGIAILEAYQDKCADTLCILGDLYKKGSFVDKNINKAEEYYMIGAEKNDAKCCALLGWLHLDHKKDFKTAQFYFKKAKENGFLAADYALGRMFFDKSKEKNDLLQAKEYFLKAAENNIKKSNKYLKKIDALLT